MHRRYGIAGAALLLAVGQAQAEAQEDGIDVGGAVRFQLSFEDYDSANRDRSGDFDLDTVRINFDGTVNEILLSAEWRYYQYMEVIHHAWVGYNFNPTWQAQLGATKVPFGLQPFASHGFFFSSNYYLGLEDDYDFGIKLIRDAQPWNLQLAFFKNDEQGGVDGYVSDRSDRYSYDVVGQRPPGEGTFATPSEPLGEVNTVVGRAAYTVGQLEFIGLELGASALAGELHDPGESVGDYQAFALHLNAEVGRWNLQLQAADYDYELDSGLERLAVGAYAFFDTIPAEGRTYVANLAYTWPVAIGPIQGFTFYSDNSLVTDKAAGLDDTVMNVLGVAIDAGALYTYVDLVSAENQPFIGGSMAGADSGRNTRLNVNVGFYF